MNNMLNGYRVIIEDGTYTKANREPVLRRWMRPAYFKRLAKKWRKRFGTHQEPVIKPGEARFSQVGGFMVMRSADFANLKRAIAAQGARP